MRKNRNEKNNCRTISIKLFINMKKILLSICTLLAFAGSAKADDAFSVDNVTLPQNGEADVTVRFALDEGSTCSGYTFWLQVPEELAFVTYEKNEKTYITCTAGDCYDDTPTITPNIDADYLKVGCLTANSDPLNKQSGVLVTFRLRVIGAVNVGDVLTGTLTNGTISAENGSVHNVANASFTITISEAVGPTVLDENSTTVPEATADAVDIKVLRTIKANEWSTICLPFAMTEAQVKTAFGDDVELADFTDYDVDYDNDDNVIGITVSFDDIPLTDGIEANYPCLIKTSKEITEFAAKAVIEPDEDDAKSEYDNGRTGRNRKVYGTFQGTFHAQTVVPENCLFLNGNKFWYSKGLTKMKAFRAYFEFVDVLASVEGDDSRISMAFGHSTGISDINRETINNNRYYDLQGRRVANPGKGVFVKDGKKVIIK